MRSDRDTHPPTTIRGLLRALAVVCAALWTVAASATVVVEFPGAVPIATVESATAVAVLPYAGNPNDLAIATVAGEVRFVRYFAPNGSFANLGNIFVTGEIIAVTPVVNAIGAVTELLVATRNPDACHVLGIRRADPYAVLEATLDLEEDPSAVVALGRDLAAVALGGMDTLVWIARGESGWVLAGSAAAGDRPRDLAACDLDGDGVVELVVANGGALSRSLMTFVREGDGYVFAHDTVLPEAPSGLAGGDLDGDGNDEIAVVGDDSAVLRIFAAGTAGLTQVEQLATTVPVDVIAVSPLPGGAWGLYPGSTTRGIVEFYLDGDSGWSRRDGYYPGCRPYDLVAADLNADGYPDLVSAGGAARLVTVMFGSPDLAYWGFPAMALPARPGGLSLGDFNDDGLRDVVVASEDAGTLAHFHGRSTGGVEIVGEVQELFPLPGPIAAIDADATGGPELAVYDRAGAQIHITEHEAGAGFVTSTTVPLTASAQRMTAADVDGDGNEDLAVLATSLPEVHVLFSAGDRTFPVSSAFGFDIRAIALATVDLDADGRLDLVGLDGINRLWMASNGDGRSFAAAGWLNVGSGSRGLATGDLDGDLDDDVVVVSIQDKTLTFFENTGSGSLDRRVGSLALSERPEGILLEDVNQDGRADVLVNQRDAGTIAVVYGLGNWTFTPPTSFAGGGDVSIFATEDFNADLIPDILTLDASLHLGLTMLNVERSSVAVAHDALEVDCAGGSLHATIRPDRPGPWRLELGKDDSWRLLATDAGARIGTLDVEAGVWYWRGQVAASARDVLRLTVGAAGAAEQLVVAPGACGAADGPPAPATLAWRAAPWPNPFNPGVRARVELARPSFVSARVYDLRGRLVATLLQAQREAGTLDISWDGTRAGRPAEAGTYLLRIIDDRSILTSKLMLLK